MGSYTTTYDNSSRVFPSIFILISIFDKQAPRLAAFEYGYQEEKPHSLLFVGGLSDGLYTVPYLNDIVEGLEDSKWSVFSVLLSSSYMGWGTSDLDKDVDEISQCVEYVKKYKSNKFPHTESGLVAVMGHSTGSQDVLHYVHSPNNTASGTGAKRSTIDGGILQAPVSDREALLDQIKSGNSQDSSEALSRLCKELVDRAKKAVVTQNSVDAILPPTLTTKLGLGENVSISSKRFLSLTSPDSPENPREDDLFSSDLTDERLRSTFGAVKDRGVLKQSLMFLPGGSDEFVPTWVDKEKLLKRWEDIVKASSPHVWNENSGIVKGATHSPSGPDKVEPRKEIVSRVKNFIGDLEKSR